MDGIWEDFIALNSADQPEFETLPKPADIADRTSWSIDTDKIARNGLDWYLARDISPVPVAADREGYYDDRNFEYWLSGLETHNHILDAAEKYDVGRDAYFDFGGASGRVARHVAAYGAFKDTWVTDINWRHVAWINRYLPPNIKAIHTSSIPTLPMESRSIDFITAMSVFTHIETFELQWLAELARVLKPGGVAIITVVTDKTIAAMDETWPMYAPFTSHSEWGDNFADRVQRRGKCVLRWRADRSYSSNVIYSDEYIKNVFGRFFEILEIRRQFPIYQDSLFLRRR